MARRLEINADDLVDAMSCPPEQRWYLDTESGEVELQLDFEEEEDEEEETDELPGRREDIPRVEGSAEYRRMAEFADAVDEDDVREQLRLALDGRGAFGRFRNVLRGFPDLWARWEEGRRERFLAEARDWLASLDIEPVFTFRAPAAPAPARPPERRSPRVGLLDLLLLGAPEGKTELLEGKVYRVFLASSPSEARAVFKNVARDLCELHGVAWRNRFIEGRDTYAVDRFELRVEDDRVELDVEVSRELWRKFAG